VDNVDPVPTPEITAPPTAATPDSSISSTPDSTAPSTIPATDSSASPTPAAVNLVVTYGVDPSEAAKMVCGSEVVQELTATFNVAAEVTTPTWTDHLLACTYQYPGGSFALSVKELPTIEGTVDYFTSLKAQYTTGEQLGLGQGGFLTAEGMSIVRKDNKVLVVDVSNLPVPFGTPPLSRWDASLAITFTILGCWIDL
jgi:hypothetical protein